MSFCSQEIGSDGAWACWSAFCANILYLFALLFSFSFLCKRTVKKMELFFLRALIVMSSRTRTSSFVVNVQVVEPWTLSSPSLAIITVTLLAFSKSLLNFCIWASLQYCWWRWLLVAKLSTASSAATSHWSVTAALPLLPVCINTLYVSSSAVGKVNRSFLAGCRETGIQPNFSLDYQLSQKQNWTFFPHLYFV